MAKLGEDTVCVTGKFEGIRKEEVWARLLATGVLGMNTKAAGSYLAADPNDPKLIAAGKPIFTLAACARWSDRASCWSPQSCWHWIYEATQTGESVSWHTSLSRAS